MTVDQFINKIFFALLFGVVVHASGELNKVSDSVVELNKNMAVVLTRVHQHDQDIADHKNRINEIERKK